MCRFVAAPSLFPICSQMSKNRAVVSFYPISSSFVVRQEKEFRKANPLAESN